MRRVLSGFGLVCALSLIAFAFTQLAEADDGALVLVKPLVFTIPATYGYGVEDCLAKGAECGRIVANAWCQTQGLKQARSYGNSSPEDVTGSVASARPVAQTVTITCDRN
jgi:hypothetical protein